jgi:stearoyl-CoA desaturase (Delta-9 desaturase)
MPDYIMLAQLNRLTLTLMHLLPLSAFWLEVHTVDWIVCLGLYWLRLFAVTAGYHRYFSHRTFKLGRLAQLVLAILAQSSGQKGVLWWAAHHRTHHKHSDTKRDVHSPVQYGFWWAHMGWFLAPQSNRADYCTVKDLAVFPELLWLDKYFPVPAWGLGVLCFIGGGPSTFVIGFALSTLFVLHCTYAINSFAHLFGSQRFATSDESRNNPWLAILTLGEGWHNNHHYCASTARQGFVWWEIDPTYYLLKVLSLLGIVKNLKPLPARVTRVLGARGTLGQQWMAATRK